MNSRVGAIIRKEFIQIRRDRRTLAIVLVLPVMQLLLFGYAINTVVDHLPTIVLDETRDADSRALVSALSNSGYYNNSPYQATITDLSTRLTQIQTTLRTTPQYQQPAYQYPQQPPYQGPPQQ